MKPLLRVRFPRPRVGRALAAAGAAGLLLAAPSLSAGSVLPPEPSPRVVFTSYAVGADQARKVRVLVRSIRTHAGPYRTAQVVVAADQGASAVLERDAGPGVRIVRLEVPEVARRVPFAAKAYAAAQVERLVAEKTDTLLWMDPESVLLAPPEGLVLGTGVAVALQPVFLVNRVGLRPDQPLDPFWTRIYREIGLRERAVPLVRAVVDDIPIRFYINCGAIAYRPSRGLCQEWARVLTALLSEAEFRALATADVNHAVFLHQAVLSAIICARTRPVERQWIPITHGYPLGQHARVPAARRVALLNDVVCLIYDTVWDQQPDWLSKFPVDEPLKSWLREAYRATLRPNAPLRQAFQH